MKRTALITILMIFCLSITACAADPNHPTNAQSSIFHSLNVTHTDRSIIVKADAYVNITDAAFLTIEVSDEESVSLTYTLTKIPGILHSPAELRKTRRFSLRIPKTRLTERKRSL